MTGQRRWTVVVLLLGIGAAAAGASAWRASAPPSVRDVVKAAMVPFDPDGSGRISLKEWARYHAHDKLFQAYDFDGDGTLDVDEFEALIAGTNPALVGSSSVSR